MKGTFRNFISRAIARLLISSGRVDGAIKKALDGEYILSIYFHHPEKEEFEQIVKWLMDKGFKFLSLADVSAIGKKEIPFPKGGVVLTVDDGWESNEMNIVEVAEKYNVPIAVFMATEAISLGNYWFTYAGKADQMKLNFPSKRKLKKMTNQERLKVVNAIRRGMTLNREAMTIEQVKRIAKSPLVTIGAHTFSHPILTECSDEEVDFEVFKSKNDLEEWLGIKVTSFAYPNGDYGIREVEALKRHDYQLAFTTQKKYLTPQNISKSFALPRFGFLEGASLEENICRVVGLWNFNFFGFSSESDFGAGRVDKAPSAAAKEKSTSKRIKNER
jgi:peptidoglycan/xylan/chitin deacetylase (PgdA/CDA1 family)